MNGYRDITLLLVVLLLSCQKQEPATDVSVPFFSAPEANDPIVEQANHFLQEAHALRYTDVQKALVLVDSALNLPATVARPAIEAAADYIRCTVDLSALPAQQAFASCTAALTYYQNVSPSPPVLIGDAFNYGGIHLDILGKKDSSILFFQASEAIFRQANDAYHLSDVLNNYGVVFSHDINQGKAIDLYIRALAYAEESSNIKAQQFAHLNLGRAYHRQLLLNRAELHLKQALQLSQQSSFDFISTLTLTFLGDLERDRQSFAQAKYYYELALETNEHRYNNYSQIMLHNGLIDLHLKTGDLKTAEQLLWASDTILADYGSKKMRGETNTKWGRLFLQKGQMDAASPKLELALQLLQEVGDAQHLIELYEALVVFHERSENYVEALICAKRLAALKNDLVSSRNASLVYALESEYQLEKKDLEISVLQQKSSTQAWQLALAILIGSSVLLFTVILFRQDRRNRQLNEELEERVRQRTKTLERSNQALERFAYIASHDLKTPLQTVSNFLALIHRKIRKTGDAQLEELINLATIGARQMGSLIDSILTFAQISSSAKPNDWELVELEEIVDQIRDELRDFGRYQPEQILSSDLPVVYGKRVQIYQLMLNLISNGLKYNESEQPSVNISCKTSGKRLHQIEVLDNGIGIPAAYRSTVFEMFKRLHSNRKYDGTGIGLALCKTIIEQHQGKIWIEDGPVNGTRFCLQLPSAPEFLEEVATPTTGTTVMDTNSN